MTPLAGSSEREPPATQSPTSATKAFTASSRPSGLVLMPADAPATGRSKLANS